MKKSSIFLKKPIDKEKRPCYNEYKFKVIEQNRCNGRKDEVIMNVTMKAMLEKLVEDFNNYSELVAASDDEDKDKICKLLCKVLQLTRGASDLKSLDFNPDAEIVTAVFEGGSRTINVACDSGTAMIRDIMNHLER